MPKASDCTLDHSSIWQSVTRMPCTSSDLRKLLVVLNSARDQQHDILCMIRQDHARGLIMLRAVRDLKPHEWMFTRRDSLLNALSLFNKTLREIKCAEVDYETSCTLGLLVRDVTFEATVVISMLWCTYGEQATAAETPDLSVLFPPDRLQIHKAMTCSFPLQSKQLIVQRPQRHLAAVT